MGDRFRQIAFTAAVQAEQERHGSRRQYATLGEAGEEGDRLHAAERQFLESRDSFYMAVTTETGWPYVQHRGGTAGFLKVIDDRTVGFADLRGNRQYISVGSLRRDDRVALFLMDYPSQSRLKILGRAEVHEGTAEAQEWLHRLVDPVEKAPAERAFVIHVDGFDWNCPQHITPRYTEAEIGRIMAPMRERMERLETENSRLRSLVPRES